MTSIEENHPPDPESARSKHAARKALDARIERKARSAQFVSGGKRPKYLNLIDKREAEVDAAKGVPTTDPLSAQSGDSPNQARIRVAGFEMQYRSVLVPYSSGSIGPLRDATRYFVYFDDPALAGGAQNYLATEKKHEAIAKEGRATLGEVTTPPFSSQEASFESFAGALFEGALQKSTNHRVSKTALLVIAEKLDRSEFVFDLEYLEKQHRKTVADHNKKYSRVAIKTWRELANKPVLQQGLRRLLAHAAEKTRSRSSGRP
jgi:hypothetical protein